jgi:hypothetical protein
MISSVAPALLSASTTLATKVGSVLILVFEPTWFLTLFILTPMLRSAESHCANQESGDSSGSDAGELACRYPALHL